MSVKNALGRKGYPVPVGTVLHWAVSSSTTPVPKTFLPARGQSLRRDRFPQLFEALGTLYGAADADHFNLPNLNGKYIKGAAVNNGTITTAQVLVDPFTLTPNQLPELTSANFNATSTGATNTVNRVDGNDEGWWYSAGSTKVEAGTGANCLQGQTSENRGATATLTALDLEYVNPAVTPVQPTTTGINFQYANRTCIMIIKVEYEEPVPTYPVIFPPPVFPPSVILADPQISGFII